MTNVIPLGNITKLNLLPDDVLERAKGKMEGVVLIGWDNDGELYFSSTYADGGNVLWLLEKTKQALLNVNADDI